MDLWLTLYTAESSESLDGPTIVIFPHQALVFLLSYLWSEANQSPNY